jgi:integrase/recombinase XerD
MSDLRQMPLFVNQPATVKDLNKHTPLKHTIALFQQQLMDDGKSEHTVKAFTGDLQLLAEHTDGDTPVGQYTTDMLNDFLAWLEHGRGVPCSRKSYARRVTTLKVYFKWLNTIGALPHDPARAVLQRSGPAPLASVLSGDDIHAAIFAARQMKRGEEYDTRPEMLFRLILDTGIKKSEAMALTPADVDRADPQTPALLVRHKTRNVYRERRIALQPDWPGLLDIYLMQYRPQSAIFNCTARNLEYILSDISEAAELPVKISFEMLRWTCAVRDIRGGTDPDLVREKLGLSRISWVETYAKVKKLIEQQIADESASV